MCQTITNGCLVMFSAMKSDVIQIHPASSLAIIAG
jgi:hypothetical protein